MVTGGGYATLKEAMSVMGVPVMTKNRLWKRNELLERSGGIH